MADLKKMLKNAVEDAVEDAVEAKLKNVDLDDIQKLLGNDKLKVLLERIADMVEKNAGSVEEAAALIRKFKLK